MRGIVKARCRKEGRSEALNLVQLSSFLEALSAQLSGGASNSADGGRTWDALVIEPAMLLLDEPLEALEQGPQASMQVSSCGPFGDRLD